MNCCDRPDIWLNNNRWPLWDGMAFGVCVRCSAIVIASPKIRRYTPLESMALLHMYRDPATRWIYEELTEEQRGVRKCITRILTRPDCRFELPIEQLEHAERR